VSRLIGFTTSDRRGLLKPEDARGGHHHSSWLRIGLIVATAWPRCARCYITYGTATIALTIKFSRIVNRSFGGLL